VLFRGKLSSNSCPVEFSLSKQYANLHHQYFLGNFFGNSESKSFYRTSSNNLTQSGGKSSINFSVELFSVSHDRFTFRQLESPSVNIVNPVFSTACYRNPGVRITRAWPGGWKDPGYLRRSSCRFGA
jgi:hypothetical protein